jgi:hypothetical protein
LLVTEGQGRRSSEIPFHIPLLHELFDIVGVCWAFVVPALHEIFSFLERQGNRPVSLSVKGGYGNTAFLIRNECLETVNFVFQLGYVLTASGRKVTRKKFLQRSHMEADDEERAKDSVLRRWLTMAQICCTARRRKGTKSISMQSASSKTPITNTHECESLAPVYMPTRPGDYRKFSHNKERWMVMSMKQLEPSRHL